ncbi:glutamine synthetase family protein [Patescibacteria group bacterium]
MKMSKTAITEILKKCQTDGVSQLLCMFPDILGQPMVLQVSAGEMEKSFKRGCTIDGSSVDGFSRINESDLLAVPDSRTFRVLPWTIADQKIGIAICDIKYPDGRQFPGDTRYLLKRALSGPAKKGWSFNIGPELEFFLFQEADQPTLIDRGRYFSLVDDHIGLEFRTKVLNLLEAFGIEAEVAHHEVAYSQHEVNIRYLEALEMADKIFLYRWFVQKLARDMGYRATFMPKPIMGINGSGMHTNQSIEGKNGRNLFFNRGNHGQLSRIGQQYLAGLLTYAPQFTAVLNQFVNSYKRLVPGMEAPVYICYGT